MNPKQRSQRQTLLTLSRRLRHVEAEVGHLRALMEDTALAPAERSQVVASIRRIASGDSSEFVRWPERSRHV